MLLLLLFAVAASDASASESRPGPAAFYPPPARADRVEGRARISCTVTAEGRLTNCAVISEEPAGYGFGDAALRMSKGFKMKPTANGDRSFAGAKITVPFAFKLPPAPASSGKVRWGR